MLHLVLCVQAVMSGDYIKLDVFSGPQNAKKSKCQQHTGLWRGAACGVAQQVARCLLREEIGGFIHALIV